jgi:hypothetical protein
MRVFVWIAGINAAICLLHIIPALLAGRLAGLVAGGIPMRSEAWWNVLISLPLASGCMVGFLIVAIVVGWWKRVGEQPLRIYYTLVVIAATGHLVLLNHWRLIVLPG